MGIDFSAERWQEVSRTYESWWSHQLERPVLPVWLEGRDPGRACPSVPLLSQATCADLSIPAEALIDRLDYELSRYHFMGDAFPLIRFDSFGPGLVAAFLGARLDNSTGRVWFHPEKVVPVSKLHPAYDPDNIWLKRVRSIYEAGLARWGDQVLMSQPDLGGALDILSTFRPSENLLYDLVDDPEEVKRVNWELHELWHKYFNELSAVLRSGQQQPDGSRGWSDWGATFSTTPSYILQCDFSYMISPDMFEEYVRPELAASARRLGRAIYHLDGVGEIAHLDSILKIPEIHAIQWVPGDGKPPQDEWPELYQRIHEGGKAHLVFCGFEGLARITETLGISKGLCHMPIVMEAGRIDEVRKWLDHFGL